MSDSLEELAKKGRESSAQHAARDGAKKTSESDFRRYLTDRLVAKTFQQVHRHRYVPALFAGGIALVGLLLLPSMSGSSGVYVIFGTLIAAVGGGYVVNRMFEGRAVAEGIRWSNAQPYHFPGERYLAGLSKERMNSRVKLSLTFQESPSSEDRQIFQDACAGAATIESSNWSDRTLNLTTPQLATYFAAREDSDSYYSNAQVHLWTRNIMDKAVPALNARCPIVRVKISFID